MKPKLLVVIFLFVILALGGGVYYFISQPKKIAKPVMKEIKKEVVVPKEESKLVEKDVPVAPVKIVETPKPVNLNVHMHDFDEDFICNQADGNHFSCNGKDKDRNLHLDILLIKSIPNGKFTISENKKIIIEGSYIHGFINGEVIKRFSSGSVNVVENYKSGLLDGPRKAFSQNSSNSSGNVLRQEQNWVQGQPDGVFVKNGFDGSLIRKVQFSNGAFKGEV